VALPINYTTCDAAKLALPATWPGCVGKSAGTVLSESPIRDTPGALRDGAVRRYSLSARGGGDRFSYYLSGDHDYEEGVLANSFNRRNSLRSNFSFTPSEKADFQINFGVFDARLRLPLGDESAQGILFASQRGRPGRVSTLAGQTQEGFLTVTPGTSNMYDNETHSNRITFGTTFNYQPFTWFRNRMTLGLDWTNGLAEMFAPPNTPDLTADTLGLTAQRMPRNTLYTLDYSGSVERSLTQSLLSTTSVGSQVIASRNEVLSANGRGLGSPDVTLIGSTSQITAANSFSENNSVGYYVQEQLGWNNRLFVTAALRADDNSSFGTDFNVITYPKASLSWIVSEEPSLRRYFAAAHADNLKLRAAWGAAGKAPAPYTATRTYTISTVTIGPNSASGIRTGEFGNPGLKPERGVETEVGFDAELFQSRVGVEFTYYNKKMDDVLFSQSIAPSTGFRGGQQQNIGSTANSGMELGLTATPVRRSNVVWDSRVSLSTNQNRLVSFGDTSVKTVTLSGASYGSVQQNRPGYPIAGFWARFPRRNPDGTPIFAGTVPQLDTAVYVGPSLPTREIAFSNTVTLFNVLSLYGLLDYKAGHYNYRGAELYRCGSAQNCIELNDPNFPATEVPLYRVGAGTNAPYGLYIHKADFVKLRDLSATLLLPQKYAALAKVSRMSVTLAGHNLAIWSDYPGPDPEVSTYGSRDVTRAFLRGDIYSMPMTRRLSATLNLAF
jgi:outer membrane receptor protein involved in Fe transport